MLLLSGRNLRRKHCFDQKCHVASFTGTEPCIIYMYVTLCIKDQRKRGDEARVSVSSLTLSCFLFFFLFWCSGHLSIPEFSIDTHRLLLVMIIIEMFILRGCHFKGCAQTVILFYIIFCNLSCIAVFICFYILHLYKYF